MMFILILLFFITPLSNSKTLEDGVGTSQRREAPIIIDPYTSVISKPRDRSTTLTNKKGKKKDKKIVISMDGLVSSTSHLSSYNIIFPPTPILYTQTEAFNASFQPSLRHNAPLKTIVLTTYPSHEGVTPL